MMRWDVAIEALGGDGVRRLRRRHNINIDKFY